MAVVAMKSEFSRDELRRLVAITERQLKSWELLELVEPREIYTFPDVVKFRALQQLRKQRVAAPKIKQALTAISRKLHHVTDPLTELRLYVDGKRIRVEVDGGSMEVSGQLLLNFGRDDITRLLEFKPKKIEPDPRTLKAEAERWFQKGLELEQKGGPIQEVLEAYNRALELDPKSAGALVNLGTIHFNARGWREAERYYKLALEADPQYALAHFDLANLYDERGERSKALDHYQIALKISPNYADAHYNIALLYQGSNQVLRALRHWREYLKLDPKGHWASIARRELEKLERTTVLTGSRG